KQFEANQKGAEVWKGFYLTILGVSQISTKSPGHALSQINTQPYQLFLEGRRSTIEPHPCFPPDFTRFQGLPHTSDRFDSGKASHGWRAWRFAEGNLNVSNESNSLAIESLVRVRF